MSPPEPVAYRSRWVFPIDLPPLAEGIVTVCDGRIVELGHSTGAKDVIDLGDVTLLPGLVNAHTHLEFSDLTQPLGQPRQAFPDWIRAVVAQRRNLPKVDNPLPRRSSAVAQGLAASAATGTAVVGEIANPGWPAEPFRATSLSGVVFLELLGLRSDRIEPLLHLAKEHLASGKISQNGCEWLPGLSPHAPYTVHPELLRRVCQLSAESHVPVAMHLAESYEELELLAAHCGRFVEVLEDLKAWRPDAIPRGIRPADYLRILATAGRALVIHGTYLVPEEIEFLAQQRETMSLVYCPRTHAYFQASEPPLRRLLAAGVRVAVGTDSLASNPDLSIWEELRLIRRTFSELDDATILRIGTLDAASALGLEHDFGSITPGKRAVFTVIRGNAAGSWWDGTANRMSG